jgi:hypothetical protein
MRTRTYASGLDDTQGDQPTVHITSRARYGVTLLLATGSDQHIDALRKLARKKGWMLDERGLHRKGSTNRQNGTRQSCARPATKCSRAKGQAPRTREVGRSSPRAARPYVRIRRRRYAESHGRSCAPAQLRVSLMIHRLPFQTIVRTGSISKPVALRIQRSIQRSQCGHKRHHTRRGSNPTQSFIAGNIHRNFSLSCDSRGISPNVGLANASTLDRRNFHSRGTKYGILRHKLARSSHPHGKTL